MKKIVVIGAGFGGLNAARILCHARDVHVTLVDERNYYLFLPLLYQVAVGALSPDDIAIPIRSVFSRYPNVSVLQKKVESVDLKRKCVVLQDREIGYDHLVMACGARQTYFGHEAWEGVAPGLKTLEQAAEIRDRILGAFERAEVAVDEVI